MVVGSPTRLRRERPQNLHDLLQTQRNDEANHRRQRQFQELPRKRAGARRRGRRRGRRQGRSPHHRTQDGRRCGEAHARGRRRLRRRGRAAGARRGRAGGVGRRLRQHGACGRVGGLCADVGAEVGDDGLAVAQRHRRGAVAADRDRVDRVVDLCRRAIAALLVARPVPRRAALRVGARRGQVRQVEGLAAELGQGQVDRQAVLGRVRDVGDGRVDEDDRRQLALVVGRVAHNAVLVRGGLAGDGEWCDAGCAPFADDLCHGGPGAVTAGLSTGRRGLRVSGDLLGSDKWLGRVWWVRNGLPGGGITL